jgi:hypothetical protein
MMHLAIYLSIAALVSMTSPVRRYDSERDDAGPPAPPAIQIVVSLFWPLIVIVGVAAFMAAHASGPRPPWQ